MPLTDAEREFFENEILELVNDQCMIDFQLTQSDLQGRIGAIVLTIEAHSDRNFGKKGE